MTEKLTKESVDYRRAAGARHCGNCSMFVKDGSCTLVRGHIRAGDICDRWEVKK